MTGVATLAADLLDPQRPQLTDFEADYEVWLRALFPSYVTAPLADHHRELWAWLWAIEPGERPDPFVAIWSRGGAKSTSGELGGVSLGALRKRRYGLYICGTQDQADDHVGNVSSMLEAPQLAEHYPALAERKVSKYGSSRGWRRNRLWTRQGFVVDAIGLDTAARGVKLEEQRPDFMVIDDVDAEHDSPRQVAKKIDLLTKALIPAGSRDLAILAIQNLIHADGVFARLADGRADFLARRIVSGPIPALRGAEYSTEPLGDGAGRRVVITAGEPTWRGQDRAACQGLLDDIGLAAFERECQHEVNDVEGALWSREQIAAGRVPKIDPNTLDRVVVGVDPSGADDGAPAGEHDEVGILVVGRQGDIRTGHGYALEDRSLAGGPRTWGRAAVQAALDWDAECIVLEANYGGAMGKAVIETAMRDLAIELDEPISIPVKIVNASRGKKQRAEPVAALYGDKDRPETWPAARMHHVGELPKLEGEQRTWEPLSGRSPNRMDAHVWAASEVMGLLGGKGRARTRYRGGQAA